MLMICPKAEECIATCKHKIPHSYESICDREVPPGCMNCIPYKEKETLMLKVGDRVKVISNNSYTPDACIGLTGKIYEKTPFFNKVLFDINVDGRLTWNFYDCDLELIKERVRYHGGCHGCETDQSQCSKCQYYGPDWRKPNLHSKKEKSMPEYRVVKEFTKYDYIVQHQKMYGWTRYFDAYKEFKEDMDKLCDPHMIWRGGYDSKYYPYSDNFWTDAVKFGFMEVVEKRILETKLTNHNCPVVRLSDNTIVFDGSCLYWDNPSLVVNLKEVTYEVIGNRMTFYLKD